ncbi:response regulator transcription factor [Pedobacter sp. NJ-S-72]
MFNIGLAEDDVKIASLVKTGLEEHNYNVTTIPDGIMALYTFQEEKFDLLILDVMMPGMNGIEVCRQIRQTNKDVPILMLTALGSIDDKVLGLNSGADDYLVKPFHFKELLARIEAMLRRQQTVQSQLKHTLSFEDILMDTYSKTVHRAGKDITLTAKEFTLLELFLKKKPKPSFIQTIHCRKCLGYQF